ncbi:MAG: dihydrodipicolinate synthase family protein, partial [bacterium]|nr:dihydrodipicolinate synthase family protein [bacterium]
MTRRSFLRRAALAGAGLRFAVERAFASEPGFRGIFPIVQTPYTDGGEVDFQTLEREVKFLDRTGVHGIVWPQRASQYQYLTLAERLEGMEVMVAANRGLRPKLVLGVQGPDTTTAVKYARHAQRLRPDAIVALPTRDQGEFDLDAVADYYAAIGKACDLPMFVQTTGNMSVEFVLKMARRIPTLRFVKDEAGHTISRIGEFRRKGGAGGPKVFTGSHGRTLIDEMMRGVAGNMPASGWVDLYVRVWDLWHDGRRAEALDIFSKIMLFVTQATAHGFQSLSYVLHLRGVFPNY